MKPPTPKPTDEILRQHLETIYLSAWRTLHPLRYDTEKHPLGPYFAQMLDQPALRVLLLSAIDGTCDDLLYVALEAPLLQHAPHTHIGAAHIWWRRVSWLKGRILGCFVPWDPLSPPQHPVALPEALGSRLKDEPTFPP